MLCYSWSPVGCPVPRSRGGLGPGLPGVRTACCLQNASPASARMSQYFWCILLKIKTGLKIWIVSIWSWTTKLLTLLVGCVPPVPPPEKDLFAYFLKFCVGLGCELQTVLVRGSLNPGWFDDAYLYPLSTDKPLSQKCSSWRRIRCVLPDGFTFSEWLYCKYRVTTTGQQKKEPRLEATHWV